MNAGIDFRFADLRRRLLSDDIGLLFPGWQAEDERLLVLCPHDDDGVLGAGYAILAAQERGAEAHLAVFCDGWAGYSRPEEASTIVARRRQETVAAYALMGIPAERIHRLDYPDFAVWPWLGWRLPTGQEGISAQLVPLMRRLRVTRLLLPNGYREHQDHEATFRAGAYDGPQVGDAVLGEVGLAPPIRSYLQYAVWADFDPEDALVAGEPSCLRANRAIVAPATIEERIEEAVAAFASQRQVIAGVMETRRRHRVCGGRALELFLAFDPRPLLDYRPYHALLAEIDQGPR